jgi:Fe-S-cluster containining protein
LDNQASEPQWQDRDIVEGLQALYLTVDQVVAGVAAKTELPCRRGCSHCCKDVPPPVSPSEWKAIVEHLRTLPTEPRRKVLGRALELYARHTEQIEQIEREPQRFDELSRAMGYECPFLVEEACSIYPARPHACRLYGNSFIPSQGKMFACHLVEEALLGQEAALVNFEGTLAMLRLYPDTTKAQVFPWYVAHRLPEDLAPDP